MTEKKRRPIPVSKRFEVFKRDSFKCQYCGKSAPEVTLQIDHIKPVSKGGTNTIMNLITACVDCNYGKGAKQLDDNSTIEKQKRQLDELSDRREQMKMMLEWREEIASLIEEQVDYVDGLLRAAFSETLSDKGRRTIKELISKYGFSEVLQSADIGFAKYKSAGYAIDKLGGICYNRRFDIKPGGRRNG